MNKKWEANMAINLFGKRERVTAGVNPIMNDQLIQLIPKMMAQVVIARAAENGRITVKEAREKYQKLNEEIDEVIKSR